MRASSASPPSRVFGPHQRHAGPSPCPHPAAQRPSRRAQHLRSPAAFLLDGRRSPLPFPPVGGASTGPALLPSFPPRPRHVLQVTSQFPQHTPGDPWRWTPPRQSAAQHLSPPLPRSPEGAPRSRIGDGRGKEREEGSSLPPSQCPPPTADQSQQGGQFSSREVYSARKFTSSQSRI